MRNQDLFPSRKIKNVLYDEHKNTNNVDDLSINIIAHKANVKRRDVIEQFTEINNYLKHLGYAA